MIFGSDNRQKANSSFALYPSVVQIISYFPDGSVSQGSGIIVGYNDVLTAAHVIYDAAAGGYADAIEVTPARDGQNKPYGVAFATSSVVSSKWIANEDFSGDYGIITLNQAVGYYTGFADIATYPNAVINKALFGYGYPGDLSSGKAMYYTSGAVDRTDNNILQFTDDFDAKGGQSGSGVFYDFGSSDRVVGVVSYESVGGSQELNAIAGFSESIVAELNSWISGNDNDLIFPAVWNGTDKGSVEDISLLYYAFLNREPDKAGLDFWISKYQSGISIKTISEGFFDSGEYAASAAGSFSNAEFVNNLYVGILGRDAEASGAAYWAYVLNNGGSRADVANSFVFSSEFETRHKLDIYSIWHRLYDGWKMEVYGIEEDDILSASSNGDSKLYGYDGNDIMIGSAGDDYLWGMGGMDTLTGGIGADFFAWGIGDGYDTVTDFSLSDDYIRLRDEFEWSFGVNSAGYLSITPLNGGEGLMLIGIFQNSIPDIKIIQGNLV